MPELFVMLVIAGIAIASLVVVVWPAARICQRIGFSPWLAALVIVPVGNVVLLWFVALADWPADRGTPAPRRP